jgi:uncharacterized protein (DUF1778 family)
MQPRNEGKVQLNVRLEERALKAITAAASEEGKKVADYVRIAALTATCHTLRKAAPTVYIDPREGVTLDRAQSLGMTPVIDVGGAWQGEVRAPLGKNGLFQDKAGGVWLLTPQGLKQVMGFERAEEVARIATKARTGGRRATK